METIIAAPEIWLSFGQSATACRRDGDDLRVEIGVPLLSGMDRECVVRGGEGSVIENFGHFHALRAANGEVFAGAAVLPCGGTAESASYELYRDLLRLTASQPLFRVWHFVPGINVESGGLEQYQSFNVGRFRAFRECFREGEVASHLPAASAVGIDGPQLALVFLSGRDPVRYFENPRQVPAYQYPEQYGPCSPSFARGAVVTHADGRRTGYLSGTASIRGHESVAVDDVLAQLDVTLDNVEIVLDRMGFSGALAADSDRASSFRVYLRHAEDLEAVRERFGEVVGADMAKRTVFLRADICRSSLRLEIEGIFTDSTGLGR